MASGIAKWDPAPVQAEARAEARKRLEAAAIVVENRAKKLLSVAGTGRARSKTTGRFIRGGGARRSPPGEPPYKQTGRLRSSITHELVSDVVARVGTNLKYGRYLEVGTARMRPRPYLRRALAESQPDIQRIFGG